MEKKKAWIIFIIFVLVFVLVGIGVGVYLVIQENKKEQEFKDAVREKARFYQLSAEVYYAERLIDDFSGTYKGGVIPNLPKEDDGFQGKIEANADGDIQMVLHNGTYCVIKKYSDEDFSIQKKKAADCHL